MLASTRRSDGSWSSASSEAHTRSSSAEAQSHHDPSAAGASARTAPPGADLRDVVRAAGLGAGADGRGLPPTERLAPHDRAGDVPVDVGVAHLDALQPVRDLGLLERVQTAGQAE